MKILLANWELKILAVLAAVIFWILVIGTENSFYTFPEEVQIKAFNVSEDLVLEDDPGKVKLRLKVTSSDITKNLTPEDFNAYVDLQGLKEGQIEVPVLVSSKKPEVAVLRVEPSSIKITIEKKSQKEVPVEYKTIGDVKEGYTVKEVKLTDENAIIRGSQEDLNSISAAIIEIDLGSTDKNIKKFFPLKMLDLNGNPVANVTADKPETQAEVIIAAVTGQKVVGVKPNIIGTPPENVWIKSINVNPSVISLNGSAEILKDIEFVQTSDINVEKINSSQTFTVNIRGLPEGVTTDSGASVSVYIELGTYDSGDIAQNRKTLNVYPVVRKFKAPQANHKVDPASVAVVVQGDPEDLEKIQQFIQIELDITEYKDNSVEFILNDSYLTLPEGVDVVSITPSKVVVTW